MHSNKSLVQLVGSLASKDREEMKEDVLDILGNSLIRIIDSHNTKSIIFIYILENTKYLLKVEFKTKDTILQKEIIWYKKVGVKFSKRAKFIDGKIGERVTVLLLEFLEETFTIDDLIFDQKIDVGKTNLLVNKSVDLTNYLFEHFPKKNIPVDKMNLYFNKKFEYRYNEAKKTKYLQAMFGREELFINGKVFKNFQFYISNISKNEKIKRTIMPTTVGTIHGDLHFDNILVKSNDIFLIDPKYEPWRPVEYDYGKIFHSIHGGYGSIMRGRFELNKLSNGKFHFFVNFPTQYTLAFEKVARDLSRDKFIKSLYMEAMHFATMLPHHVKNEKETIAIYLRGVQLFQELFSFPELSNQLIYS